MTDKAGKSDKKNPDKRNAGVSTKNTKSMSSWKKFLGAFLKTSEVNVETINAAPSVSEETVAEGSSRSETTEPKIATIPKDSTKPNAVVERPLALKVTLPSCMSNSDLSVSIEVEALGEQKKSKKENNMQLTCVRRTEKLSEFEGQLIVPKNTNIDTIANMPLYFVDADGVPMKSSDDDYTVFHPVENTLTKDVDTGIKIRDVRLKVKLEKLNFCRKPQKLPKYLSCSFVNAKECPTQTRATRFAQEVQREEEVEEELKYDSDDGVSMIGKGNKYKPSTNSSEKLVDDLLGGVMDSLPLTENYNRQYTSGDSECLGKKDSIDSVLPKSSCVTFHRSDDSISFTEAVSYCVSSVPTNSANDRIVATKQRHEPEQGADNWLLHSKLLKDNELELIEHRRRVDELDKTLALLQNARSKLTNFFDPSELPSAHDTGKVYHLLPLAGVPPVSYLCTAQSPVNSRSSAMEVMHQAEMTADLEEPKNAELQESCDIPVQRTASCRSMTAPLIHVDIPSGENNNNGICPIYSECQSVQNCDVSQQEKQVFCPSLKSDEENILHDSLDASIIGLIPENIKITDENKIRLLNLKNMLETEYCRKPLERSFVEKISEGIVQEICVMSDQNEIADLMLQPEVIPIICPKTTELHRKSSSAENTSKDIVNEICDRTAQILFPEMECLEGNMYCLEQKIDVFQTDIVEICDTSNKFIQTFAFIENILKDIFEKCDFEDDHNCSHQNRNIIQVEEDYSLVEENTDTFQESNNTTLRINPIDYQHWSPFTNISNQNGQDVTDTNIYASSNAKVEDLQNTNQDNQPLKIETLHISQYKVTPCDDWSIFEGIKKGMIAEYLPVSAYSEFLQDDITLAQNTSNEIFTGECNSHYVQDVIVCPMRKLETILDDNISTKDTICKIIVNADIDTTSTEQILTCITPRLQSPNSVNSEIKSGSCNSCGHSHFPLLQGLNGDIKEKSEVLRNESNDSINSSTPEVVWDFDLVEDSPVPEKTTCTIDNKTAHVQGDFPSMNKSEKVIVLAKSKLEQDLQKFRNKTKEANSPTYIFPHKYLGSQSAHTPKLKLNTIQNLYYSPKFSVEFDASTYADLDSLYEKRYGPKKQLSLAKKNDLTYNVVENDIKSMIHDLLKESWTIKETVIENYGRDTLDESEIYLIDEDENVEKYSATTPADTVSINHPHPFHVNFCIMNKTYKCPPISVSKLTTHRGTFADEKKIDWCFHNSGFLSNLVPEMYGYRRQRYVEIEELFDDDVITEKNCCSVVEEETFESQYSKSNNLLDTQLPIENGMITNYMENQDNEAPKPSEPGNPCQSSSSSNVSTGALRSAKFADIAEAKDLSEKVADSTEREITSVFSTTPNVTVITPFTDSKTFTDCKLLPPAATKCSFYRHDADEMVLKETDLTKNKLSITEKKSNTSAVMENKSNTAVQNTKHSTRIRFPAHIESSTSTTNINFDRQDEKNNRSVVTIIKPVVALISNSDSVGTLIVQPNPLEDSDSHIILKSKKPYEELAAIPGTSGTMKHVESLVTTTSNRSTLTEDYDADCDDDDIMVALPNLRYRHTSVEELNTREEIEIIEHNVQQNNILSESIANISLKKATSLELNMDDSLSYISTQSSLDLSDTEEVKKHESKTSLNN